MSLIPTESGGPQHQRIRLIQNSLFCRTIQTLVSTMSTYLQAKLQQHQSFPPLHEREYHSSCETLDSCSRLNPAVHLNLCLKQRLRLYYVSVVW